MDQRNILIIGGGIAGLSAAKSARKQDPSANITILTRDGIPPFYRLRLCEMIGKDTPPESLYIHPLSWYADNGVVLKLSHTVLSINATAKTVTSDKGVFSFDALVLAEGSFSFMPPFAGRDLSGVHTLWDFSDIAAINADLKNARSAVVIGGGLLGLETAYCVRRMGIETTLIENMPRLLPKQLDEEGSAVFGEKVRSHGISVVTGQNVKEFQGEDHIRRVLLADGQSFPADIAVVSAGVRPNTAVLTGSGIAVDRYVPVNEKMQAALAAAHDTAQNQGPSDPPVFSDCIFAAGDVACFRNVWYGQWAVSMLQGQIAGANAAGGQEIFTVETSPYVLNTMGTKVVVVGDTGVSAQENADILQEERNESYSYIKLVFKDGLLVGGILIGDYAAKSVLLQSLLKKPAPRAEVSLADFRTA